MTGPSDDDLNAVLDGQASRQQRRLVERALAGDPALRARFELDRRILAGMRRAEGLSTSSRPRPDLRWAAGVVLALGLGSGLGWAARDRAAEPPMSDAVAAYARVFQSGAAPALLPAGGSAPDLRALGYVPVGRTSFQTPEGEASLVAYEGGDLGQVIVYVRPADRPRLRQAGLRRDGATETRYWFDDRRGYAVTGTAPSAQMARLEAEVRAGIEKGEGASGA